MKNVHKNNILIKTEYKSDSIKDNIKLKIKKVYENLLNLFDTKGVICCEFFEYNNEIYINEIALRVYIIHIILVWIVVIYHSLNYIYVVY